MPRIKLYSATLEHIDHVRSRVLSRRYDIPYANEDTWMGMQNIIGEIEKNIKIIKTGEYFNWGYGHTPFSIFHDTADPVGYCINYKKYKPVL